MITEQYLLLKLAPATDTRTFYDQLSLSMKEFMSNKRILIVMKAT